MLRMFLRLSGWIAVIPLVIGLGVVFVSVQASGDAARLEAEGVEAKATVINTETRRRRSSTGSGYDTVYSVRYHFPIGGGTLHYGRRDVERSFYDRAEPGMQIPVRFVPAEPDIHEIEAGAVSENAFYAGLVGGFFALLGVILLFLFTRRASRAVAVRDRGERVVATVSDVVQVKSRSHIRFRFTDRSGVSHEARSLSGSHARFADITSGDTIAARYDPDAPDRAFWERDLGL